MTSPVTCFSDAKIFFRFQRVAAVLEKFVAACPASLDADTAARKLGMPVMEVTSICRALEETGLLMAATEFQRWHLGKPKVAVTLEDVWMAIGSGEQAGSMHDCAPQPCATDLLVSQALIEMQQSISRLLRQFQLHRVSTSCGSVSMVRIQRWKGTKFNESLEKA